MEKTIQMKWNSLTICLGEAQNIPIHPPSMPTPSMATMCEKAPFSNTVTTAV